MINGTSQVKNNTWDIHFNNVQVMNGSVEIGEGKQAATIDSNDTSRLTFSVKFNRPGDYYEFTVDIVNAGTLDGMIGSIESKVNNQDISNLPSYMEYSITYLDGDPLGNNFLLSAGNTGTIKVRVGFNEDISEDDLLDIAETLNFSLPVNYTQARSNAVNRLDTDYVYWNNFISINNNDNINNFSNLFSSEEEVLSNSLYNFFVRSTARKSGGVIKSDIGFVVGNNIYYVLSGGVIYDEATDTLDFSNVPYTENKATLNTAFGNDNCFEDYISYNGAYVYTCSNSSYGVQVKDLGDVSAYLISDEWECYVDLYDDAQCNHGHK